MMTVTHTSDNLLSQVEFEETSHTSDDEEIKRRIRAVQQEDINRKKNTGGRNIPSGPRDKDSLVSKDGSLNYSTSIASRGIGGDDRGYLGKGDKGGYFGSGNGDALDETIRSIDAYLAECRKRDEREYSGVLDIVDCGERSVENVVVQRGEAQQDTPFPHRSNDSYNTDPARVPLDTFMIDNLNNFEDFEDELEQK